MISPKYYTHYYYAFKQLSAKSAADAPHVINLYLDYTCPFSAKLFGKLYNSVIPKLHEKHPNKFQFVFVNVIQPWHPNATLAFEFALVAAGLLAEKTPEEANKTYWALSSTLFKNALQFQDSYNVDLNRNEIYEQLYEIVAKELELPFSKSEILDKLQIKPNKVDVTNAGNGATAAGKYFTKYLRGVGVHVTPTVSVDGIVDNSVSSGSEIDELVKVFEAHL
ncbi:uncharacterized protein CANTADRAFT_119130 [Suhomyces tanzawaensis NRRL Y-17324]|uniref:Uncharacterized protein n=1 Tax=Suhomyces tanzawaensis NRRL Y-17324 TaxID=984487 RepID=A0A1E4SQF3_9ASCO|nr:uncharacterized protein CANTADRAFT_119130 [Suhomyces tanzawaensis NRRL Y-17324]ODV81725.1 hypothetical protein CANTADRAFT_119130 [Suhomyces tanzawaensis NRRL Y-17324]